MPQVFAKCKTDHVMPYISADGIYWPCCWVPNHPHTATMKQFLGNDFEQLDVSKHDLAEIAQSNALQRLEASWQDGSFAPCLRFCSEPFDEHSRMTTDQKSMIKLRRRTHE